MPKFFYQFFPNPEHIAGPHGDNQIARFAVFEQILFQPCKTVNIRYIFPGRDLDRFRKIFPADTGYRILAGRINVRKDQLVTVTEAFTEFFIQQFRAGVPVGLEYTYDPFGPGFLRSLQRGADFRRVMCVIVNDPYSVFFPFGFKVSRMALPSFATISATVLVE